MIKIFCDVCLKEITIENEFPLSGLKTNIHITTKQKKTIEISLTIGEKPMDSHCCRYCVIDSIESLDNRDRPTKMYAPADFIGEHASS